MTDTILWVYVTVADADEALEIGRSLVRENLAACVNLLPGHTAIYRQEGALHETEEAAFTAKTTASRFEALRAHVRGMHSFDTPAILALPVADGDADFLEWVRAQVRTPE